MSDPHGPQDFTIRITVNHDNLVRIVRAALSGPPPYGVKHAPAIPGPEPSPVPGGALPEPAPADLLEAQRIWIDNRKITHLRYFADKENLLKHDGQALKDAHDQYTWASTLLYLWIGELNMALQDSTVT